MKARKEFESGGLKEVIIILLFNEKGNHDEKGKQT